MVNGTVTRIKRVQGKALFRVTTADGGTVIGRKIVLATGLRDILPTTPGLRENYGKGIWWCPWCDGHEHADQPLAIFAPMNKVPGFVAEVSKLNSDIIAFVNGTNTPGMLDTAMLEYLKVRNITVENRIITAIERLASGITGEEDPSLPSVPEFDRFKIRFSIGRPIYRNAIFLAIDTEQASNLGSQLGVHQIDGQLTANRTLGYETNIPGVYAVGDAGDGSPNVLEAMASGKRAAVAIHFQLGFSEMMESVAHTVVPTDGFGPALGRDLVYC
ncbi:hypothetical protein HIM_09175 [Hirsutella minnesotensis 3608]|uniref:FAD/NAD(P)-binding domain-containing protein n=1 Tax=Hirsutella minnesotensis 3608 TaxID=1043627 RepID=A0A0F7ZGT5_9HYPO|nr:hypothetical protein HIM_09175 [Hirsutella minnesotensis 3608]